MRITDGHIIAFFGQTAHIRVNRDSIAKVWKIEFSSYESECECGREIFSPTMSMTLTLSDEEMRKFAEKIVEAVGQKVEQKVEPTKVPIMVEA